MKITFHGSAREVTGARHLLEVNGKRILLDCGLFQGKRKESEERNRTMPFQAEEISAVILSHAHMDHSGNLPLLVKKGFKGSIYSTFSTRDLCTYMLMDSAFIQQREAEYLNKKNKRKSAKGQPNIEPLYTPEDAQKALDQFQAIAYDRTIEIYPDIKLTLFNSGHILGSSLIQLDILDHEDNKQKRFVYTGDLGRKNLPILKDPHQIDRTDYLVIECTYGNRLHEAITEVHEKMAGIVSRTIERGGRLIIPAFSLGRTQEILYTLHHLFEEKRIPADLPIIVDSPLSGNITEVFKSHPEDFDEEARKEFVAHGENPFGFGRVKYTASAEESKALNNSKMPMIIISSSGMCEHGRILHHLKNSIEDPRNTILIVGFMAKETLGRKIIEKTSEVNIFGDPYRLRAEVTVIDAFSGHADRSDLIDYIKKIKGLKHTFLVHGEEKQAESFKTFLAENGVKEVTIPHRDEMYPLD